MMALKRLLSYSLSFFIVCFGLILPSTQAATDTRLLDVVVKEAGIYRLSYQYLLENNLDLVGLKHRRLSFSHNGIKVATHSKGQTNDPRTFGPGAYIEFVVPEVDTNLYSDKAVYTLHYLTDRADQRKHFPVVRVSRVSKTGDYNEHYKQTIKVEQQNNYSILSANTQDPWNMATAFVSARGANDFDHRLDLPGYVAGQGRVSVSARVAGVTSFPESPDHHVQVRINDQVLGAAQFDGVTAQTLTGDIASSQLSAAGNTLTVGLVDDLGLPFDVVEVDHFTVSYPSRLTPTNNRLSFASNDVIGQSSNVKISHFNGAKRSLRVYQIVNGALSVVKGMAKRNAANNQFDVYYTLQTDARYLLAAEGGFLQPVALRNVVELDNIRDGNAEYLIIAHADFINDELAKLATLRRDNYHVKVVDIAQIYAQFGADVPDAAVIKKYIEYAVKQLSTKMVLLVGGDSRDYHGYKVGSAQSFVPTLYVPTKTSLTVNYTPSDAVYGDLDNDGIPELAVGRLPVRTEQELADMVTKITLYEQRNYNGTSVIAADKLDSGNQYSFSGDADGLIANMPASWRGAGLYKAYIEQDGAVAARDQLFNAINQGVAVTAYVGHTSRMQWASSNPHLLHSNSIPEANAIDGDNRQLTNFGLPTLVTQWGCWNSYFVDERTESISQSLLLKGTNGAVASIGASSLTTALGEKVLGRELYKEMFKPGITLGEALVTAKQNVAVNHDFEMSDIQLAIQLLGDPAIVMTPNNQ